MAPPELPTPPPPPNLCNAIVGVFLKKHPIRMTPTPSRSPPAPSEQLCCPSKKLKINTISRISLIYNKNPIITRPTDGHPTILCFPPLTIATPTLNSAKQDISEQQKMLSPSKFKKSMVHPNHLCRGHL